MAAPSADTLLSNWKNAIYTNHEHSQITLTLLEPGSSPLKRQAEIWYKSKSAGESQILMKFKSPASIAGVAFLSLRSAHQSGADQWLYFPAYKKARRLSSHNRDESFLDSDFSNGDISFEYEDAFDIRLRTQTKVEENIDGRPVYVLEGIVKPSKKEALPYSREVLFISKTENLNLRSEFYDQKNALVKVIRVANWKKYADRWSADKIQVENVKTKHQSVLSFEARDLSGVPPERLFTMSELESGH